MPSATALIRLIDDRFRVGSLQLKCPQWAQSRRSGNVRLGSKAVTVRMGERD